MIPAFNLSGVLPPFLGPSPTGRTEMSPYAVSMVEVVKHFATSHERIHILTGLLDFRAALRAVGIVDGFQWLDGSFVEDVEKMRNRAPADVDIVTFAHRPTASPDEWRRLVSDHLYLFDPRITKAQYHCDAYFVDLDKKPFLVVDDTRYWFGLFSHQRVTSLWKGMLSVPLQSDDDVARSLLE
ncbi:MAG: hypothetical protein IAF00_09855 [Phycisphaerales bacterium]|nr:hypothetical protein [Phycisphaerales bacterium]